METRLLKENKRKSYKCLVGRLYIQHKEATLKDRARRGLHILAAGNGQPQHYAHSADKQQII